MKQIKQKLTSEDVPKNCKREKKTIRNSIYIPPKDEWYQLDNEWIFLTM